ncbi:hypothetical protein [Pedobacter miscanthi]|uniref:Uncharacterized protein n=1 Tax=Pedobacter miscanthi TaxID=2259170 RepID=A0A366KMW2_9SPHI|nr:hypothetical protein [Pedobacter miscanthi]RBQ02985.1 hypothetical protein DRW42_23900 [Pedobacter miscanthi]
MDDSAVKITFEKLTELVKALSNKEKQSLMNILMQEKQFIVQETAVAYLKSDEISFEEKWQQSLSAKEFEKLAHNNIQQLPWKQL